MKSLLKATRITGDPIVLMHARKDDALAAQTAELPPDAPPPLEPPHAGNDYEAPHAGERAAADAAIAECERLNRELQVTYDEYKQRLQAELSETQRRAHEDGLERGLAEGRERAQSEYAARLEALAGVVASARAALDDAIAGVSDISVDVVCEALAKIVGQAMIEKRVVISTVQEVVRQTKDRTRLVVRVCPRDWALLEDSHDELIDGLSVGRVEVVADERVQLGGCLLETSAGDFDGRLEVQLERLRDALERAAPARPEPEICT